STRPETQANRVPSRWPRAEPPYGALPEPDVLQVKVAQRRDEEAVQLARIRVRERRVVDEPGEGVLGGEVLHLRVQPAAGGRSGLVLGLVDESGHLRVGVAGEP